MTQPEQPASLGRNASVLLDIVRFGAAVAVVAEHLKFFSMHAQQIPDELGNMAVCVFFVLSGFVIRFVTESRVSTLRAYLIDRASRIYSVLLPAMVFTVVAILIAPHFYAAGFGGVAWSDFWKSLLVNVTFTHGFWGEGKTFLGNGVLWSLSFEVMYYVLYGLIRYTRVTRWWLVPLLLVISGPSIAALFPVWLLGAFLYDVYRKLYRARNGVAVASGATLAVFAVLLALRHPILQLIRMTNHDLRDQWLRERLASSSVGLRLFHGETVTWLSRLSVSYYFVGLGGAALLLLLMLVGDRMLPRMPLQIERGIRTVADSTFTLYCIHLPMLTLLFSLGGGKSTTVAGTAGVTLVTVLLCIPMAGPLDKLKNKMRAGLRSLTS